MAVLSTLHSIYFLHVNHRDDMWCRRAMVIHLQQQVPLTQIRYHLCTHPQPTEWTSRLPFLLQGKRNISAIFADMLIWGNSGWMSSYRESMSHSRTLWQHKQLLQGWALLLEGQKGSSMAGVTIDHHCPNMLTVHYCDDTTPGVLMESKMCTLLEVSW